MVSVPGNPEESAAEAPPAPSVPESEQAASAPPGREQAASGPPSAPRYVLAVVAAFAVVLLVLLALRPPAQDADSAATRATAASQERTAVVQACQDAIRADAAGALRTSTFPPAADATVDTASTPAGPAFLVRSYFDVASQSGARTQRTTYSCTVRSVPPAGWQIISLQMP